MIFIPLRFDQVQSKLSQVLLNSQNEEIVRTVHKLNYSLFNLGLITSHAPSIAKQFLQKTGFTGLPDSDSMNEKKKAPQTTLICNILDAVLEK